jgi:hypothetical protein
MMGFQYQTLPVFDDMLLRPIQKKAAAKSR